MKTPLILFALVLTSCSTTVYDRQTGHPIMRTYANATGFNFTDGSTSLSATTLNHSTPTRAAGSMLGTGLSGVAGIITAKAATGGL